jgi:hypothetical protein
MLEYMYYRLKELAYNLCKSKVKLLVSNIAIILILVKLLKSKSYNIKFKF